MRPIRVFLIIPICREFQYAYLCAEEQMGIIGYDEVCRGTGCAHCGAISQRNGLCRTCRTPCPIELGKAEVDRKRGRYRIVCRRSMVKTAEEVQKLLHEKGYKASIINARFIKPIDEEAVLSACEDHAMIVTMEENVQSGGFGEKVLDCLNDHEKRIKCVMAAIPDAYVEHGNVELLKRRSDWMRKASRRKFWKDYK